MDETTKNIVYLSSVVAAAQIYNSIRTPSSIIGREALVPPDASPWSRLYEVLCFYKLYFSHAPYYYFLAW